jgi:hypothetical protein
MYAGEFWSEIGESFKYLLAKMKNQNYCRKVLEQHASRSMLIFMQIKKMYLKVKYCGENKKNLHTALTFHVNYQKEVKR